MVDNGADIMRQLGGLQAAALAARRRTGEPRLSATLKAGRVTVGLTTPRKGRAAEFTPLSGPLDVAGAVAYLDGMQ